MEQRGTHDGDFLEGTSAYFRETVDKTRKNTKEFLREQRENTKEFLREKRDEMGKALEETGKKATELRRRVITGDKNKRVRDFVQEEPVIKLKDKISFTLGVAAIMVTELILLRCPWRFGAFFAAVSVPLLLSRYYLYFKANWGGFLLDFCYFTNFACLALTFHPSAWWLHSFCFVAATGPLAWAIVAWRNSLVFHSLDRVTSTMIHFMPPLYMYCVRWYGAAATATATANAAATTTTTSVANSRQQIDQSQYTFYSYHQQDELCAATGACAGEATTSGWHYFVSIPMIGYVIWQCAYVYVTEVQLDAAFREKEIQTSMRWMTTRASGSALPKFSRGVARRLGIMGPKEEFDPDSTKTKIIFMTVQFVYTLVTILPVPLFYYNFYIHTCFLLFVFMASVWNGAGYYVHWLRKALRPVKKQQEKQR